MSIASRWLLRLAGHSGARERALAEASRSHERREMDQEHTQDDVRFRAQSERLARAPHVVLGTDAGGAPYRIPLQELASLPIWLTAATGAGKSRCVGAIIEAVIRNAIRGERVSVVLVDGKGETADALLRSVAGIAMTIPATASFLSRIHTFRFFSSQYLPSWPLLARMPGVPIDVHADAVAEVLTHVAEDASMGPRQRSMLAAILAVAIEFDVPMAALPWLLNDPSEVAALALRSSLPFVRLELARFEREPQGSVDGLVARLGTLLRVPSLKAVLSGPRRSDFSVMFEPGAVTVLDFGGADLGARAAVRAMGSLAITALANAAFDPRRTLGGTTMIVVDEPQALMTGVTLGQFERLVTLGRSFGAGGLVVVHQGATQLPAELQAVLNTNVPLRILGRSSAQDAAASSEWLPHTGRVPRRRERGARPSAASAFLSEREEERFHIAELGHLPARHFLVTDRRAAFAPRIIRAPDYDPPAWSAIDPAVADAVLRGSAGIRRDILEARVRELEDRASARLDERRRADGLRVGGRAGAAATPNVVGTPARRRRRGDVP